MNEKIVVKPVGESSRSAITKLNGIGNVVVRCCTEFSRVAGEKERDAATRYCREQCSLRPLSPDDYQQYAEISCPEKNTLVAYKELDIKPEEAITIAVTGNEVGFDDEFDDYVVEGVAGVNPEGWKEAKGFNAFFADSSKGVRALGRRLADCGDLNIEFKTTDGRTIIGFMHLTRPGQTVGQTRYKFGPEDRPVSFFEHALGEALSHYGETDVSSVSLRLRTAIEAQDFVKHFDSKEAMEGHVPGWYEDGFLENVSNPRWSEGDPHDESDMWHADFKGIVTRDIVEGMNKFGLKQEQLDMTDMLDTMHDPSHSSHERAMRNSKPDTRDLYITYTTD